MIFQKLQNKKVIWMPYNGKIEGKLFIEISEEDKQLRVYVCQNQRAGADCGRINRHPYNYSYVYAFNTNVTIQKIIERMDIQFVEPLMPIKKYTI